MAARLAGGWVGVALCGAGAVVVAASDMANPATRSGPVYALIVAVVAAGVAGRLLAQVAGWLPALVVALGAAATVSSFSTAASASEAPPLGYANTDAALFAVGGLAALAVALGGGAPTATRAVAAATAGVLAVATALTGSAAGATLLLAGAALVVLARASGRMAASVAAGALVVATAGTTLVAVLFAGDLRGRSVGSRVALWRDALRVAVEHPWLGVGPGGFEHARTVTVDPDLRWAHHETLQAAAELGFAGGALLLAVALWALVRSAQGVRPAGAAALGGVFAVSVHACFDYVLHEAAVVLPVAFLVGAAGGRSRRRPADPAAAPALLSAARPPRRGRGSRG